MNQFLRQIRPGGGAGPGQAPRPAAGNLQLAPRQPLAGNRAAARPEGVKSQHRQDRGRFPVRPGGLSAPAGDGERGKAESGPMIFKRALFSVF